MKRSALIRFVIIKRRKSPNRTRHKHRYKYKKKQKDQSKTNRLTRLACEIFKKLSKYLYVYTVIKCIHALSFLFISYIKFFFLRIHPSRIDEFFFFFFFFFGSRRPTFTHSHTLSKFQPTLPLPLSKISHILFSTPERDRKKRSQSWLT